MEEPGLHSPAPGYYCHFSKKTTHNEDNFHHSGYYPRKAAPAGILTATLVQTNHCTEPNVLSPAGHQQMPKEE